MEAITGKQFLKALRGSDPLGIFTNLPYFGKTFLVDMFERTCIYFLYQKESPDEESPTLDGLVYVGQTKSLLRRIKDHRYGDGVIRKKKFNAVGFVFVDPADVNFVEAFLITALKPKYNKQYANGSVRNGSRDDWNWLINMQLDGLVPEGMDESLMHDALELLSELQA